MTPRVTVVLPAFDAAAWVPRAAGSLLAQTLTDWELVVVDDGSPDPGALAAALPEDPRIRVHRLPRNLGLGAALNAGLELAAAPLIAYLPADDVLHADHLATLVPRLEAGAEVVRSGDGLVHLAHRATPHRWLAREQVETDRLDLLDHLPEPEVLDRPTATATEHPGRRHRLLSASLDGGVNAFRRRYRVPGPLRIEARDGTRVDEVARYARFRRDWPAEPEADGLRILLAGELAYNPERVLALRERGHHLAGWWIDDPLGFMSVGPQPFGGVEEVARPEDARADVVYALLNWRAVPLAHGLLDLGVPLVFHFKEAPQRSIARGEWPLLADLVERADAVILSSPEERAWFEAALPGRLDPERTAVLDGDLPKREWFDAEPAPERLGDAGGEVHTVLLGRPAGMGDALRAGLRDRGVHLHAPSVEPQDWVRELSRYDAGWLHPFTATNDGDVRRATWDDLNLPARIPTLLAGGLPLILPRSPDHAVHAAQAFLERTGAGVLYEDLDDLAAQLRDRAGLDRRRAAAWAAREAVTFDHHADRLVSVLRAASRRRPRR